MTPVAPRVAGGVVLVLAAVGVLVLRDQLMTVHERSGPGSVTEVLVAARTHKDAAYLPALTGSLVESCRLSVDASVRVSPLEQVRPGEFAFELRPALDRFGRRELRGCLQDLREEDLIVDVRRLESSAPPAQRTGPSAPATARTTVSARTTRGAGGRPAPG